MVACESVSEGVVACSSVQTRARACRRVRMQYRVIAGQSVPTRVVACSSAYYKFFLRGNHWFTTKVALFHVNKGKTLQLLQVKLKLTHNSLACYF